MLKNLLFLVPLSFVILLSSCDGYKKTDSGIEYKFFKDSAGTNVQAGDGVYITVAYTNDKDTIKPTPDRLLVAADTGGFMEAIRLMSVGDSAEFKFINDSLFKERLPKELEAGGKTTMQIKISKVTPKAEIEKMQAEGKKKQEEMQKKMMEQYGKDTVAVMDYLKSKNIKAQRTEAGVYYVIKKKGAGPKVGMGDSVSVEYTGRLMSDNKEFDSSKGKGPFTFQLMPQGLIHGWIDVLLNVLREGDVVTVYIPSVLAYGEEGAGPNIPANSNLIFDMEVVKVKKMPVEPAK